MMGPLPLAPSAVHGPRDAFVAHAAMAPFLPRTYPGVAWLLLTEAFHCWADARVRRLLAEALAVAPAVAAEVPTNADLRRRLRNREKSIAYRRNKKEEMHRLKQHVPWCHSEYRHILATAKVRFTVGIWLLFPPVLELFHSWIL